MVASYDDYCSSRINPKIKSWWTVWIQGEIDGACGYARKEGTEVTIEFSGRYYLELPSAAKITLNHEAKC